MFSTTTMASSTTMPMASTRPNRVRLLIDWPDDQHHREGPDQRHRDGDGRNQGGPEVLQEDVDREDDQQDRDDQRLHHLGDRLRDVLGGVVGDRPLEPLGEVAGEVLHRRPDPVRHRQGVGAGDLVDAQKARRLAVELGVPGVALGPELDPGHVADPDHLAPFAALDDDVLELLDLGQASQGGDRVLEVLCRWPTGGSPILPAATWTFCSCSAPITSAVVSPRALSRSGSSQIRMP